MRYHADITAGSLKVPESRVVADLLFRGADDQELEIRHLRPQRPPGSQSRDSQAAGRLIRDRLETMDADLWKLVRDGTGTVATHACLAAAVKHSPLLGDFLDLVVREQYRLFVPALSNKLWDDYSRRLPGP